MAQPFKGDWFRGDEEADVTVFDIVQALSVDQVDEGMLKLMLILINGNDPEDFIQESVHSREAALLFGIVDACGSEKEFSELFKRAVRASEGSE